jgi:hypothetical protein
VTTETKSESKSGRIALKRKHFEKLLRGETLFIPIAPGTIQILIESHLARNTAAKVKLGVDGAIEPDYSMRYQIGMLFHRIFGRKTPRP